MRPDCRSGDAAKRAWLSKAGCDCPAALVTEVSDKKRKAAGYNRRLLDSGASERSRWPRPATRTRLSCLRVVFHHPVRPVMLPTARTAVTTPATRLLGAEPGEHDELMLWTIVKALVERTRRISEFLEPGCPLTHHFRTKVKPFDRILWTIGTGAGGNSLGALLREFPQCAFYRRPVLLLFSSELEASMKRGDARFTKSGNIFRPRAPALHPFESA